MPSLETPVFGKKIKEMKENRSLVPLAKTKPEYSRKQHQELFWYFEGVLEKRNKEINQRKELSHL